MDVIKSVQRKVVETQTKVALDNNSKSKVFGDDATSKIGKAFMIREDSLHEEEECPNDGSYVNSDASMKQKIFTEKGKDNKMIDMSVTNMDERLIEEITMEQRKNDLDGPDNNQIEQSHKRKSDSGIGTDGDKRMKTNAMVKETDDSLQQVESKSKAGQ